MTAAVVALLAIYFAGDGIGHIMQWSAHNTAPDNIWAIPSDFVQPAVALVLLFLYRRSGAPAPAPEPELTSAGAGSR